MSDLDELTIQRLDHMASIVTRIILVLEYHEMKQLGLDCVHLPGNESFSTLLTDFTKENNEFVAKIKKFTEGA